MNCESEIIRVATKQTGLFLEQKQNEGTHRMHATAHVLAPFAPLQH